MGEDPLEIDTACEVDGACESDLAAEVVDRVASFELSSPAALLTVRLERRRE